MSVPARQKPRDWFPHRTCVNLTCRPERWGAAQAQFQRVGFDPVSRFPAYDARNLEIPVGWPGRPGAFGCLVSHLEIVRRAHRNGLPHVLIFEDDVVFTQDLATRLARIMANLPENWDMLSFGGIHRAEPTPAGHELYRMHDTLSTHAYVLRNTIFEAFIESNSAFDQPVDVTNAFLQKSFHCYCALPHLAWQRDGFSDVEQERESQWAIRESLVLVGTKMDELIRNTAVVLALTDSPCTGPARRNLDQVLHFYQSYFPAMDVVVVGRPEDMLREPYGRCRRLVLPKASSAGRDEMFRHGLAHTPDAGIYIFSDAGVLPTRERFIRASLQMCTRYDGTTLFQELIRLDAVDSDLVCRGEQKQVDLEHYTPARPPATEGACMLTRAALDRVGGWVPSAFQRLSLLVAPNRALVLAG